MDQAVIASLSLLAATVPVVFTLFSRNRDLSYMREQAETFDALPQGNAKNILHDELNRSASRYRYRRRTQYRWRTLRALGVTYLIIIALLAAASAIDYYKLDGAKPLSEKDYESLRNLLIGCAAILTILAIALLSLMTHDVGTILRKAWRHFKNRIAVRKRKKVKHPEASGQATGTRPEVN